MKRMAITLALVGASTIGLANTSHAMTLPTPSALKEAVPSNTSQVFWRGGGWGGGGAAGGVQELALELRPVRSRLLPWPARLTGAADTGAVIPAMAYAPAYGYGYAPAPYAYAPAYGYAPAYRSLWA